MFFLFRWRPCGGHHLSIVNQGIPDSPGQVDFEVSLHFYQFYSRRVQRISENYANDTKIAPLHLFALANPLGRTWSRKMEDGDDARKIYWWLSTGSHPEALSRHLPDRFRHKCYLG